MRPEGREHAAAGLLQAGRAPTPDERAALLKAAEQAGARPIVATRDHPGWVALYAMKSDRPRDYVLAGELKVPKP